MDKNKPIALLSSEQFRQQFIHSDGARDLFVPANSFSFFTLKLEELLSVAKLPMPPVKEKNHILIFVTQGSLELNIATEFFAVAENKLVVIPLSTAYSLHTLTDTLRGFVCHFNADVIQNKFVNFIATNEFEFLQSRNVATLLSVGSDSNVIFLLNALYRLYRGNEPAHQDLLNVYLMALLYEIKDIFLPIEPDSFTTEELLYAKFKSCLQENFKTAHQVNFYAEALHITANHLTKTVKKVTGQSPIKWIQDYLILEAKVMLLQTDMSLGGISDELGFEDQSYFTRVFKKNAQCSPLEYRKKHKMY